MRPFFFLSTLLLMVALASGAATVFTPTIQLPKKKTAVVLSADSLKKTHSKYFAFLQKNFDVEYVTKKLVLKEYEEFQYENVIVFGNPEQKLGVDFIEYIDAGNNVMIVASSEGTTAESYLSDELRTAAVDCGIEFTMTPAVDNFAKDASVLTTSRFVKSKPIVGSANTSPITFKGIGMKIEDDNPLATHILSAPKTAYVTDPEVLGKVYGGNIALVAALQSRIGSRGLFSGSTDMFSDANYASNGAFCESITRWFAQQHGILRYGTIDTVKLVDGQEVRDGEMFRIKSHIRFTIDIEEFDGEKNAWVPFTPPAEDPVQVEYTMIDPYVRADLVPKGVQHTVDLQAPDVYGIFKFVVDYRRTGYNPLIIHHQAPVRPLKLNEYERFIGAAYPYYFATFSAMFGFMLIGFAFLYTKE